MAHDSKDPDGDSEMASSVDSVHTDSDGAGNGARTPTRQVHASAATAAAATSELSPPGSQPQTIPGLSTVGALGSLGDLDSTQANGKGFDAPIASWKSKRSQEEYQRAMENVIDQDFNLNEFGDPFDERDLEQKLL
ncbi:unnamed protein product [Penicillium pancosmium]